MGNARSSVSEASRASNVSETRTMDSASAESEEEFHDTIDEDEVRIRTKAKEKDMEEFQKQLNIKREQRRKILDRHKAEKKNLESAVDRERKAKLETYDTNKQLRELLIRNNIEIPENIQSCKEDSDISETISSMKEEFETLRSHNIKLRRGLAEANSSLQEAYSDIADLQSQNTESIKHVNALKEVVSVSKTMINLREQQLNELKSKLNEIERSLADREASMLSADLRNEYVKQLQNIRTLRALYEERARLAEITRQGLVRDLEEQKVLTNVETDKCNELTTKVETLEAKVEELQETVDNKNNLIFSFQEEARGLNAEMLAINKLFSQVLLGYKNKQDLDKLVHRLEENHDLLTHMAEKENGSESSSALPKLLLELVSQVDDGEEDKKTDDHSQSDISDAKEGCLLENAESQTQNTTAEKIVQNLPKVWRVLIELLSHQTTPDENAAEKVTTCYKSVETKSGPVLVPSVSQTYIRLKDLIIEKLTLIKEVNRMKQLNSHLETRLGEQEKRLGLVTNELSKTWHVVGRLRRHHHQLHTHEKILKYELQQKRKLLNELKEELAYCKEKWEQAREKNTQTEKDWRKLRAEFTSRKSKPCASFNNSAESGYSDERPSEESSESNDESEHVTEPLIRRSKKKFKKSFETILDSSADFNLAAEREDPASDMIDVADLPLDSHEGEDIHEVSDSCNSESLLKSERVCEETEDEVADEIANDSCQEELSVAESVNTNSEPINSDNFVSKDEKQIIEESTPSTSAIPKAVVIDPAAILKSIREQNERLALKDKKLERLERSGAALLNQTQITNLISKEISSTLDHLLNGPTSSTNNNVKINEDDKGLPNKLKQVVDNVISASSSREFEPPSLDCTKENNVASLSFAVPFGNDETVSETSDSEISSNKFKAILKSIQVQNEHLAQKDDRLQKLEQGCSSVVKSLSNTLDTSNEIIEKLDALHSPENASQTKEDDKEEDSTEDQDTEPSTSSNDHAARFAAREVRLKMLEEQTKSLVNKVNNTTSKGVKIHYKLEELHSIYGSEGSRDSTPSDSEEKAQNNDDETNNP